MKPSEPKYFQYRFQDDQTSLVVKVESDDSLCSVVSVQDVQVSDVTSCPCTMSR